MATWATGWTDSAPTDQRATASIPRIAGPVRSEQKRSVLCPTQRFVDPIREHRRVGAPAAVRARQVRDRFAQPLCEGDRGTPCALLLRAFAGRGRDAARGVPQRLDVGRVADD